MTIKNQIQVHEIVCHIIDEKHCQTLKNNLPLRKFQFR